MASKPMQATISPENTVEANSKAKTWTIAMIPKQAGRYEYFMVVDGILEQLEPGYPWGPLKRQTKDRKGDELLLRMQGDLPDHERGLSFTMELTDRNEPGWGNPFTVSPADAGEPEDGCGTEPSNGVFKSGKSIGGPGGNFSYLRLTAKQSQDGSTNLRTVPFTLEVEGFPKSHDPEVDVEC